MQAPWGTMSACCSQPPLCSAWRLSDWRGLGKIEQVEKTPAHSLEITGHQQSGSTATPPGARVLFSYSAKQQQGPHTEQSRDAQWISHWDSHLKQVFFLHKSAFSLATVAAVCHKQVSKKCPRELQCLIHRLSKSLKAFLLLVF